MERFLLCCKAFAWKGGHGQSSLFLLWIPPSSSISSFLLEV